MEKVDWIKYLVHNNPSGANFVLQNFGYEKEDTYEDIEDAVRVMQIQKGEDATLELLKVHPDRDILSSLNVKSFGFRNADGNETEIIKTPVQPNPYNQTQPIIVTSGTGFESLLQNTILIVVAFWLIKEIISR